MTNILVTGANGFVGRRVCHFLKREGFSVRAAVRTYYNDRLNSDPDRILPVSDVVTVGDIGEDTDWSQALKGIDVVVHLAARVHVMQEMSKNPLESFRAVNVHGTERLAKMSVENGVKRFVYISSISIHGNSTGDRAYVEDDEAQPHSPYAISKWEGELVLRKIEKEAGLELVIVRPPLVYGSGVGGNFLRLMQLARKGIPLPLGSIRNSRSFIGVENLADLIVCCVERSEAAGETFVAADGEDLSTPDLIRRVAKLMGQPVRLWPFPVYLMRVFSRLTGRDDILDRLCNSLRVDAGKARRLLKWQPGISLDDGLTRTVSWFKERYKNSNGDVF